MLSNYLNSFNFKVHYNLLPVCSKFVQYQLDNDSRCIFCDLNYETHVHIFSNCNKLTFIWDFIDEILNVMNIRYSFLQKRRHAHEYEIMTLRSIGDSGDFKIILYLTSITNYHLWKTRNECIYEQKSFNYEQFIRKLIRSVGARRKLQTYSNITDQRKVPRIGELFLAIVTLFDVTFLIDNG